MSLSIDMSTLFDNAQLIINSLWPVAAIGVGLTLGVALLTYITRIISGALGGRR
jgi:hypothetical protein